MQLIRSTRGYLKYVWVKKYDRNEPLDCRVYARAAAAVIGMDRWNDNRWTQEIQLAETLLPKKEIKSKQPQKPKEIKQKSSFWNRNK